MELTTGLAVVLFLIWYAIGIASFIYFLTNYRDFEKEDVPFTLFLGLFGIVALIATSIASLMTYEFKNNTVLFKKRK